jgi:hypothetical protein
VGDKDVVSRIDMTTSDLLIIVVPAGEHKELEN